MFLPFFFYILIVLFGRLDFAGESMAKQIPKDIDEVTS